MIGIEKVTGRILSEASADAKKIIAQAEEKCNEISAAADEKISALNAAVHEEISEEGESIVSRAKSSASMQVRNILLSAKCRSLDAAFDAAVDAIIALPDEEYMKFMLQISADAVKSEPAGTKCTLSLSKSDIGRLGQNIVTAFNNAFPGYEFGFSEIPAKIRGGVLLDFGDTDVDCSVETVIAQSRPSLEGRVCTILFDRSSSSK